VGSTVSAKAALLASLTATTVLQLQGCDTIGSDTRAFLDSFNPPSPIQAAEWALDPYDAENRRRGTTLLQDAPWGGSEIYVTLYRDRVEVETDPQVLAISIRALGRWGTPEDAVLIARRLTDRSPQVRWEAAKALQRLHNPAVIEALARRVVDDDEADDVRTAAAVALGQYATDRSFQSLAVALDARALSVNNAAEWSLNILTDERFGLERQAWLAWYRHAEKPFAHEQEFLYPVYRRKLDILDYLIFWNLPQWETPGIPVGMRGNETRSTYQVEPPTPPPPPVPETMR
jgi:hypothetical protein